jgi:hypothetical protein
MANLTTPPDTWGQSISTFAENLAVAEDITIKRPVDPGKNKERILENLGSIQSNLIAKYGQGSREILTPKTQ